nr:MAG TPA: hypothetical protein [Caudoviricetes sp.]
MIAHQNDLCCNEVTYTIGNREGTIICKDALTAVRLAAAINSFAGQKTSPTEQYAAVKAVVSMFRSEA